MRSSRSLRPLAGRFLELLDQGALERTPARRWGRAQEFRAWLEQDALAALAPEQAMALYHAAGGRQAARFRRNSMAEVRDTLDFLLYDPVKLEGRFQEVADPEGGYYLEGAGKEFASYVLCVRDPSLFGVWSAAAQRGLKLLGLLPRPLPAGPVGVQYVDFLDVLWRARALTGLADFTQVDLFLTALATGRLTTA